MKVLIALDGSPCSDSVVDEICRQPWAEGTIFRMITVEAPLEPSLVRGAPTVLDEIVRQQRAVAAQRLEEKANIVLKALPGVTVFPQVLDGWPKEVILDEAERWGADLIALGSNGYGAIRRFFLGSISLAVTTNAPCSVLIVRPPTEPASETT